MKLAHRIYLIQHTASNSSEGLRTLGDTMDNGPRHMTWSNMSITESYGRLRSGDKKTVKGEGRGTATQALTSPSTDQR